MLGLLSKKTAGVDFNIIDLDENDFEVHGWGWRGMLVKKNA